MNAKTKVMVTWRMSPNDLIIGVHLHNVQRGKLFTQHLTFVPKSVADLTLFPTPASTTPLPPEHTPDVSISKPPQDHHEFTMIVSPLGTRSPPCSSPNNYQ